MNIILLTVFVQNLIHDPSGSCCCSTCRGAASLPKKFLYNSLDKGLLNVFWIFDSDGLCQALGIIHQNGAVAKGCKGNLALVAHNLYGIEAGMAAKIPKTNAVHAVFEKERHRNGIFGGIGFLL